VIKLRSDKIDKVMENKFKLRASSESTINRDKLNNNDLNIEKENNYKQSNYKHNNEKSNISSGVRITEDYKNKLVEDIKNESSKKSNVINNSRNNSVNRCSLIENNNSESRRIISNKKQSKDEYLNKEIDYHFGFKSLDDSVFYELQDFLEIKCHYNKNKNIISTCNIDKDKYNYNKLRDKVKPKTHRSYNFLSDNDNKVNIESNNNKEKYKKVNNKEDDIKSNIIHTKTSKSLTERRQDIKAMKLNNV